MELPKCENDRTDALMAFLGGAIRAGGEQRGEIETLRARVAELEAERTERLERIWTRLGNAPDPRNPGWFVCNQLAFDQWEALRRALFNEPEDQ